MQNKHAWLSQLLCLLLTCLISHTLWASVTASTDRTSVPRGESLQLTINSDEANNQNPDISQLIQNFDILSRAVSTDVAIINGKRTEQTQWIFVLVPKQTGKITIPAIAVGKSKTTPITISVTEANDLQAPVANRSVFLIATVTPDSPYVQSAVEYTLKIYYASQIANPQLKAPDSTQIKVFQVGAARSYVSNISGRNYQVMEIHFVIIPQTSGHLVLQPAMLTGNMSSFSTQGYYGPTWRPIRISATPTSLDVQAIPQEFANQWWLPADKVTISEQFQPALNQVKAGDPISRIITIHAYGTIADNIPNVSPQTIQGASVYPDKPNINTSAVGDNLVATRIERSVIIPMQNGQLNIPATSLSWFNTKTNRMETANLPSHTLTVAANPLMGQNTLSQPTPTVNPQQGVSKNTLPTTQNSDAQKKSYGLLNNPWFWLASIVIILWGLTLVYFILTRRKKIIPTSLNPEVPISQKSLIKRLEQLAKTNDALAFSQALINLINLIYPIKKITQLGDIKIYLNDQGKQVIDALNQQFYHPTPKPWNGVFAWEILANQLFDNNKRANHDLTLPPAYPKDPYETRH